MTKTLHRADVAPKQRLSGYAYLLDQKHINFSTFHYKKMKSLKRNSLLMLAFVQYHEVRAAAALSLCFMGCRFRIRCFMYDAERLRFLFLILCPTLDLVGRGARMRETTTRERGSRRCAPVSPSLLRFSLALSFLISLPL